VTSLAESCRREHLLLTWIEGLDAGARSILVGAERADEGLARLADAEGWTQFTNEAKVMPSLRLPMPLESIQATALAAAANASTCEAFATAWQTSIESLGSELRALGAGVDVPAWTTWVAEADRSRVEMFAGVLSRHGLGRMFPDTAILALQPDLRRESLRDAIVQRLKTDEGRDAWLKAFGNQPGVEDKLLLLADRRADSVLGSSIQRSDREDIAAAISRDRDLADKEQSLAGKLSDDGSLVSVRQGFLIAISLLVCMVGIANAMLMAITERFREIATMKCLGATDGFILTQFLMEAGIQGAAGGAIGTVIGVIFSLLKGSWLYGLHLVWYFPGLGLLIAGVCCIVIGLLLATIASIYPSWIASRMAPMEAMRVE